MKKVFLSFGILILVAVLTASVILLAAPPEAEAARCFCGPLEQTGIESTDGPTCAAAKTLLQNQLEATTECQDFCQSDLVLTMQCTPNGGGGFWVAGYLSYKCEECPFIEE